MIIFPLVFLVHSTVTTWIYPSRIRNGDIEFLHGTKYLFHRFRVHWYALFLLLRNFVQAAVPVVRNDAVMVLVWISALVLSFGLVALSKPWHIRSMNWLEAAATFSMILFVVGCGFYVDVAELVSWTLQLTMFALFSAPFILFCVVVIWTVYRFATHRSKKAYLGFVCNNKRSTGAAARTLKNVLSLHWVVYTFRSTSPTHTICAIRSFLTTSDV